MWEDDYRPLVVVLVLSMLCLLALGLVAHFLVRRAVRDLIAQASHKQLLLDAENMRLGRPLRAIGGDSGSANRKLLAAALNRV